MDNYDFTCINYRFLRPQKAAHLRSLHEEQFYIRDDLQACSYLNATILPLKRFDGDNSVLFGRGGVLDEHGNYIEDSALAQYVQYSYSFPSAVKKDEKVVFCGCLLKQWGHFLLQSTARLWYFLTNDQTIDKYVFMVDENADYQLKGNYLEFFKLLGILDKLEFVNIPTTYREVIVPELAFEHWKYSAPQFGDIFERVASNVQNNPSWRAYKKIFFTRNQFKKATISELGSDMLDDYCKNNGFAIFAPEKLSLSHMIFLIRNAEECAFVSGTVPHNMVFAKEGQRCTIFERGAHNNDFQSNLNVAKRLRVTYIDAHISIYLVNSGAGPFVLSYKGQLERYTKENNMTPPNKRFLSDQYLKKQFAQYMKLYKKNYFYTVYMEDWLLKNMEHRYEAYVDALQYVGKYLNGSEPYRFCQYFQVHYLKQLIKRMILKMK